MLALCLARLLKRRPSMLAPHRIDPSLTLDPPAMTSPRLPLNIAVCWRPIPARAGDEHVVTRLMRSHCQRAWQTDDAPLPLGELDAVLILENCHWFPTILRQLSKARTDPARPLLAVCTVNPKVWSI